MCSSNRIFLLASLLLIINSIVIAHAKNPEGGQEKPAWAKKKITDYSDADMERLLDQWNVIIPLQFSNVKEMDSINLNFAGG